MNTSGVQVFVAFLLTGIVSLFVPTSLAFLSPSPCGPHQSSSFTTKPQPWNKQLAEGALWLMPAGGGFGAGGGGKKGKGESKLKPKQQWDRFLDMKTAQKLRVAVRVLEDDEWLEVGNIRSKDDRYSEIALARQRALVVDHARRLFPLQISPKDTVTWAYWKEEGEEWCIVDKSVLDGKVPAGIEKMIGFEGRPDPSSGYYCVYNEGRLVNDSDDARPSSKKLK